ncbi:SULTR1A [Auxenochlorella protothecoides x Auxenochlorella symbiontica]
MSGAPSNFNARRFLDENGISGGDATAHDTSLSYETEPRPRKLVSSEAELSLLKQLDGGDPSIAHVVSYQFNKHRHKLTDEFKSWGWFGWACWFLPCLGWLRTYRIKEWLLLDVVAGLSVGAMVIPQGMSYANLAGLPSVYGLYGAFVPCLVYSLLGSSRQLAVGPVAVTSTLLGNGLEKIFGSLSTDPNNPEDPALQANINSAAIEVAFLAGVMYTGIALLNLGWIIRFLSHSVISGFMSGAAITIALGQVKYILGLKLGRGSTIQSLLDMIFSNLSGFKWREFVMGYFFIGLLYTFRWAGNRFAHKRLGFLRFLGPITVVVTSIAVMNIFGLYKNPTTASPYIKPIGKIPKGLPPFSANHWLPLYDVSRQVTLALIICLVDVCESISIAKALAQRNKYRLNYTQELRAVGVANLFGAMFSCYTTTGSFSRSAVNNSAGAKTPFAQFVCSMLLMLTLLVLTPIFTNMSANVQGAIIIVGVLGLFDYSEFLYLYKVNKLDWIVWLITFFVVLFAGVEIGIGVGVGVSLVLVIWRAAFPAIVKLGKLPDSAVYRNVKLFPDTQQTPGVLVMRVDAPFFFANVESIRDGIVRRVEEAQATPEAESGAAPVRYVVLDMGAVTDVDATSIHWLTEFVYDLKSDLGVQLVLSNLTRPVLRAIKNGNVHRRLGPDHIFVDTNDAVVTLSNGLKQGRVDKAL